MRKKKRSLWLLVFGLLSFAGTAYFVFSYPPSSTIEISNYKIPTIPIFFTLLFLSITFLFGFIFKNVRRAILLAVFTEIYLLLRLNNLTHLFFLIILVCLFFIVDLFFREKSV